MQPLSVPRQITKRKIQSSISCRFARQAVALWAIYANDCAFNGDIVAESRFEIVNRVA